MNLDELIENFEFLGDWEQRYTYLIEIGNALPVMLDCDKTPQTKVDGCMSQVWLKTTLSGDILTFIADSDAHIVRGLIAVLRVLLSGKTKTQILNTDVEAVFNRLGLSNHLSPTRRNGFFAMLERIKETARQ